MAWTPATARGGGCHGQGCGLRLSARRADTSWRRPRLRTVKRGTIGRRQKDPETIRTCWCGAKKENKNHLFGVPHVQFSRCRRWPPARPFPSLPAQGLLLRPNQQALDPTKPKSPRTRTRREQRSSPATGRDEFSVFPRGSASPPPVGSLLQAPGPP